MDRSLILGGASIIIGTATVFILKPKRKPLLAAAIAGVAIALFDLAGIYLADYLDWWRLSGALSVGPAPLFQRVGWAFLGTAFCLVYYAYTRRGLPPWRRSIIVLLTAGVGVGNDAMLLSLGLFTLGDGMRLYHTFPYWVVCISFTLGVFALARKLINKK